MHIVLALSLIASVLLSLGTCALTTGARPDIERLMLLLIATVALDGYAILAVVTSRKRATA